jgi:hypothetical protein
MAILSAYRTGVIVGLVMTVVLLVIGSLLGQSILKSEQDAYERGARAAIIHSRCRGTFPSVSFLQRAFRWGEPQTCEDVRRVETSSADS